MSRPSAVLIAVLATACTRPNPAAFCPDGTCIDPAFGYCDVTGAIGGRPGLCLAVDCTPGELETCDGDTAFVCSADGNSFDETVCGAGCDPTAGCLPFCTAGAALECSDNVLTSCNAEGTATVTETCALGCAGDEARCLTFEPSNGLGPALREAADESEIVLPPGTRIDADLGLVQDANGITIPVTAVEVPQVGAPAILALVARSFEMSSVTISGTRPMAFVASGEISISGRLEARARASVPGPGARASGACFGLDDVQRSIGGCPIASYVGTGGGGNHRQGGRGGANIPNGGATLSGFTPLLGGCSGGNQKDANGVAIVLRGGAGGGAVQFVSLTGVVLSGEGLIDVGGGGGQSTTGGGSGGIVVIEAPEVSFSGPAAGVAANGGAGGGCGMTGADATATTAAAPGAVCPNYFAGRGGTGALAPGNACISGQDSCVGSCPLLYGGGGGSAGRMRIATKDGTFGAIGSPILSVQITTDMLEPM